MHLCLVAHEFPPGAHGGVGSFCSSLASGLRGAGVGVTVLCVRYDVGPGTDSAREEEVRADGTRVIRLTPGSPGWLRWRPGILWQRLQVRRELRSLVRQSGVNLVELSDSCGWLPFGGLGKVPVVTRTHGAMFAIDAALGMETGDPFVHGLERASLRRSGFCVAVSEHMKSVIQSLGAWPGKREIEVIHNAVDTEYFCPDGGVEREAGLIVFANRINHGKGIVPLLQAFSRVASEIPGARLAILGGLSGELARQGGIPVLMEHVSPEHRERVVWTGQLAPRGGELLGWLRRASVYCLPSHFETFGLGVAEAMSAGTPVVYGECGPTREVVEDGVSGLVCDSRNPDDIAAKLTAVLANPGFARRLGDAGRQRVLERFDQRQAIGKNLAFYASCLRSGVPNDR